MPALLDLPSPRTAHGRFSISVDSDVTDVSDVNPTRLVEMAGPAGWEGRDSYERPFYEWIDESAMTSAEVVVPIVVGMLHPTSVVDVGCGTGGWLSHFSRHGVTNIHGFDSHRVPTDLLKVPPTDFTVVDLTEPPALDRSFDLAVCLEVAEHLPESAADGLVDLLCSAAAVVLFSAAIPGQEGEDHINEQWPAHWAGKFAAHGYESVDVLRPMLWEDQRVDWYYRQNMIFYVDSSRADVLTLPDGMPHLPAPPMALVHPEVYMAYRARVARWRSTPLSLSAHVKALPSAARRAAQRRVTRPR